jgi:hypothetical protein
MLYKGLRQDVLRKPSLQIVSDVGVNVRVADSG